MSEKLNEIVQHVASSPKIAGTAAGATVTAGGGTILNYIPDILGVIATLCGIAVSIMIFRVQLSVLRNNKLDEEIKRRKLDHE